MSSQLPPPPPGGEPPTGDDPYRSASGGYPPAGSGSGYGTQPGGYGTPYGGTPSGGYSDPSSGYGAPTGGYEPGYSAPYGGSQPGTPPAGSDERTIAVLTHLSPLIAMVFSAGFLGFAAPLVLWFLFKDRSPLVRNAAASSFNFNISVWVATIAGWICFVTLLLIPVAIVLWIGAFLLQVVFSIKGAMSARRGEAYRYPLQVPILT
ncbi:DUF4870 domain-containing protein [Georgenia faecalis]|uniref:DUF4870 domain-containing protein n=1 Tax=Georgenia faecalis TaxID=2483799 RepID=UPI000FDA5091|nr:DUF4870 domain-containing protein [Georgenia faecalis]